MRNREQGAGSREDQEQGQARFSPAPYSLDPAFFPAPRSLLLPLLFPLLLTGCTKPNTIIKPEIVEVSKYVREPLPEVLLGACRYAEPDPACWRDDHREFCNEQLLEMRLAYRDALNRCDADKAALRAAENGR